MAGLRRRSANGLLWVYKHGPSQVFYAFGARCQHTPTCSEYGAECVARFGWWPGIWMALARFIRCRPGGSLGKDPVPETLPDVPVCSLGGMANGRRARPWNELKTARRHAI